MAKGVKIKVHPVEYECLIHMSDFYANEHPRNDDGFLPKEAERVITAIERIISRCEIERRVAKKLKEARDAG